MITRFLLGGVLVVLLTGCIGSRLKRLEAELQDPPPVVTPPPAPPTPPPRTPPPGPPSDYIWLAEMLTQRLEISMALAWANFGRDLENNDVRVARRAALREQAARVGIPEAEATEFFDAQLAAADEFSAFLFKRWKNPARQPAMPPQGESSIRPQLDAVDLQILATLVRIGAVPRNREMARLARERMHSRGLPASAIKIAIQPLTP